MVYGLKTQLAVGTSLGMAVFTAVSGSIAYRRQRRVDWKIGLITAFLSVPAASLGAYATTFVSSQLLAFVFGIAMSIAALRMLVSDVWRKNKAVGQSNLDPAESRRTMGGRWSRTLVDASGEVFRYNVRLPVGLVLLFGGGLLAGLLGVGGGFIIVPIYTVVMGLPIHLAVATSLFAMVFTSLSGVTVHFGLGNVQLDYVLSLAVGIVFGTQLGAFYARKIPRRILEKGFGAALITIGLLLALTRIPF